MVRVECRDDGAITVLTLDRPGKLNALSDALLGALVEAAEHADRDDACRAIVITGSGGHFAAGADVTRFAAFDGASISADARPRQWQRLADCRTPVVAAVEGWCLGAGMELALLCDVIVAGKGAVFGLPEVGLGIMPTAGGTQRLPRTVSKSDAMLMVLTGERIDAEEALAMRLISRLTETGEALAAATRLATRIAKNAPLAVENAKRAVLQAYEHPLAGGMKTERACFTRTFGTEDREEGIAAFLAKRAPVFRRR